MPTEKEENRKKITSHTRTFDSAYLEGIERISM